MHKQKIMELTATQREDVGKKTAKKLRRDGYIPVNVYGHKEENEHLFVSDKIFSRHFYDGHRIMHLNFSGKQETGMVKEVQYDPVKGSIIHVDFARISLTEKVHMQVSVRTIGVAKGAAGGGIMDHAIKSLDIEGPAIEIPEEIELHVSDMALGDEIRVKDIEISEKCTILHAKPEDVVVAVHERKKSVEQPAGEAEEAAEEAGEAGASEPEVIGKPKKDESEDSEK